MLKLTVLISSTFLASCGADLQVKVSGDLVCTEDCPEITSFRPVAAYSGEQVEVNGLNLTKGSPSITINGAEIALQVISDTRAIFIMPEGDQLGDLSAVAKAHNAQINSPYKLYRLAFHH